MFVYSRNIILKYFLPCALFAIICIVISLLIKRKKENSSEAIGQYILNAINKRIINEFVCATYFMAPLWSAVIIRFSKPRQIPFENIWGGWGYENWKYIYDFRLLYNLLMFAPIFFILYLMYKNILKKPIDNKTLVILSVIISLLYSVVIEALQIIFRVGTFQISDLVYNTLGGLIGAIITIQLIKLYKRKKKV